MYLKKVLSGLGNDYFYLVGGLISYGNVLGMELYQFHFTCFNNYGK